MKIVEVPIFYNPENAESLEAIHGSIKLDLCEVKIVYFTTIPIAYCPDVMDGIKVTRIYYGDTGFISPLKINALISIFNQL